MKEKIIIGEKMTRKGVVKNYLWLTFWAIFAAVGYKGTISYYLKPNQYLDIFIMVMIFIVVLTFLTPIIGSAEYIEFGKNEVRYYHVKGTCQQFAEVIRIIKGGKEVPDIALKTKDIQAVNLSYTPFMMAWAQKGYLVKLTFLMKDGSTMMFFPVSMDQMENGDYELALQILETCGVTIRDKFHLRTALSMNSNDFYKYVQAIEEERQS